MQVPGPYFVLTRWHLRFYDYNWDPNSDGGPFPDPEPTGKGSEGGEAANAAADLAEAMQEAWENGALEGLQRLTKELGEDLCKRLPAAQ
jgi:hypothetical protein